MDAPDEVKLLECASSAHGALEACPRHRLHVGVMEILIQAGQGHRGEASTVRAADVRPRAPALT